MELDIVEIIGGLAIISLLSFASFAYVGISEQKHESQMNGTNSNFKVTAVDTPNVAYTQTVQSDGNGTANCVFYKDHAECEVSYD